MTNVSETPAGSTNVTSLAHYTYDPLSRRTTLTYANGASTAYSYDAFSGLSQIAHTFADTGKLPTATFSYTRDNNERRVGDTVSNTAYLWHPPATATDSYTPNSLNQYTSINGKTLNYDPNGNLLGDPTAALGSTSYQFDQKNRLTAATNAQYTSTYTYDPFSRRASKTVNGVTTFFVNDGNREVAEYSSPTSEISHYIYGADSTPILREVFNGMPTVQGSYWVHTDALGSLVAITNLNGSHTSTYTYSAFGEPNAVASASPYQYAGMRLDPETMLYYDHARYYSPKQGRFISPDPISVKGGVNIYAYAANDPVNGVDTTGLFESIFGEDDDSGGGGGGGGGGDGGYGEPVTCCPGIITSLSDDGANTGITVTPNWDDLSPSPGPDSGQDTTEGQPYQIAGNGITPVPGDFSGGFHNALRDQYYNYFLNKGYVVAKEVTFSGLAPNPQGNNTSKLDLLVQFPPRATPTGIEIKTGDGVSYTQPQAWIYPQIMAGHSYSPDPQISMFGFAVGAALPPIPIEEYSAPYPGSDVGVRDLSPTFLAR